MNTLRKTLGLGLSVALSVAACADQSLDYEDTSTVVDVYSGPPPCGEVTSNKLYKRRIEPLVSGSIPSSCNQCHLSGIELAMFQGNNSCETMACLSAMDLINLNNPASSEILNQIKNVQELASQVKNS